jgi:hypothetical protein
VIARICAFIINAIVSVPPQTAAVFFGVFAVVDSVYVVRSIRDGRSAMAAWFTFCTIVLVYACSAAVREFLRGRR